MKPLSLIFLGIFLGFLQGSLDFAWSFRGAPPDLLLLYILWLGISRRTSTGLIAAFLGGFVQDAIANTGPIGILSEGVQLHGGPIGIHCLAKVVVAYLPDWAHFVFVPGGKLTLLLLVAIGSLTQESIYLSLMQTFEPGPLWSSAIVGMVFSGLLWNLILWGILVGRIIPNPDPAEE